MKMIINKTELRNHLPWIGTPQPGEMEIFIIFHFAFRGAFPQNYN